MSSRQKILLLDDHGDSRYAMELLLRHHGFDFVSAATVAEGLAKVDGQAIALLDLNLPDGSGADVLRAIREGGHPMRVAIVTGTHAPEFRADITRWRPDAYFHKPVEFSKILQWIHQHAGR